MTAGTRTALNLIALCIVLVLSRADSVLQRPCIPVDGKVGLIIGQDYWEIRNYTDAFKIENPRPFGLAAYTALDSANGRLTGLWDPINYGSGVEWAGGLHKEYPGSALQLGLYLVGAEERIMNGELDKEITFLAEFLREYNAPVYLRIGYEFDSKENNYDAPTYIAAFRRIVDRIRSSGYDDAVDPTKSVSGAENVAFVWHAAGFEPRDGMNIEDWFPGESYVDWCGISVFQQPYECKEEFTFEGCMEHAIRMAEYCHRKSIPLMIAESTPFGGIVTEQDAKENPTATNGAGYMGSTWVGWFATVLHFIDRFDVKIWTYINCDWDRLPMWKKNHAPGKHWGDSRLQVHSDIAKHWREEVLQKSKFKWAGNVMPPAVSPQVLAEDKLRRGHPETGKELGGLDYDKYCEHYESAATKADREAHETWYTRCVDWFFTTNDEEEKDKAENGKDYTFTGSDFVVLAVCIISVGGVAYAFYLYFHPHRRAQRGGYEII